jgi:excisionase family DNA binding protein
MDEFVTRRSNRDDGGFADVTGLVLIALPGIGTLSLTQEAYVAALIPIAVPEAKASVLPMESLVTARDLAISLSLPLSCIYEYAKAKRIPSVRIGRHVRFNHALVMEALRRTDTVPVGRI